MSLFASFFRTRVGQDETSAEAVYAHALTWALIDPDSRRFLPVTPLEQAN
jgi:hypothetical protein